LRLAFKFLKYFIQKKVILDKNILKFASPELFTPAFRSRVHRQPVFSRRGILKESLLDEALPIRIITPDWNLLPQHRQL